MNEYNIIGEQNLTNPYWHEAYKPHLVDRIEVRLLCFEINNIVSASMSQQRSGDLLDEGEEKPDFSPLERLCYAMAETELSKRLLRMALLVRTFDDTMLRFEQAEAYEAHKRDIELRHIGFGATLKGKEDITNTIRECCNKIIHADDVRPVYKTEDDRYDAKARWGMEGTIEFEGTQGNSEWQISIFILELLEGIIELIEFGEKRS
ncbi:hypothetical protein GCM10011390_21850 [Aureimonas endophytica]|uniref:Uncharacterized protein n=1 Tax=Aureimonas endophytica TaxID=2027858 RepID=A0A917E4F0_9HYPH|nr:hypothetical protein [Aureimonas endophytica]GGE02585.1 hypothetical protein GCM10011390_21850 [Aureimonas endophytica]